MPCWEVATYETTVENPMALSEREQKVLDEIERGLTIPDKKVAAAASRARIRLRPSVIPVTIGIAIGAALVLMGLVGNAVIVSILGFLIIVATTTWLTTAAAGRRSGQGTSALTSRRSAPRG
jgi:Protein of unknown function (DUF3040)